MNWTKRSVIVNASLFLLFLILSIKMFDLALGMVEDSKKNVAKPSNRSILLKEYSPNLNAYIRPDNSYIKDTQNLEQKDFLFRTDKDGFIVGPKDFGNANKKVSIIFFGGSTTECFYVEEENRFPYLISQNLDIRTLNGGMSGNNSIHSFLAMIAKGIPYKPNHIVLMHAINDLGALSKSTSYWDAPKGRSIIQSDDITNSTSLIYNVARHLKDFLVPNLWLKTRHIFEGRMDEWGSYRDKKSDYNNIDKTLTEQFTASLRSFVYTSRSWGVEPILMTQFNRFQADDKFIRDAYEKLPQPVSYDDFVLLYKKTNEIVRKVAKEEKVFLIDLDREIPHSKDYMYDAVHLNTKGSILVAEKITAALKNRYPTLYQ
jgi:hypothetical protein